MEWMYNVIGSNCPYSFDYEECEEAVQQAIKLINAQCKEVYIKEGLNTIVFIYKDGKIFTDAWIRRILNAIGGDYKISPELF